MVAVSRILLILAAVALPFAPSRAATVNVAVSANVLKPLQLSAKANLDFGQVVLPQSGGALTIAIGLTGVRTCPAPAVCSGAAQAATYNVSGSNGQTALITATASNLTNTAGNVLRFTPVAPASVTFTNSGNPGKDFNVGGSISISPTTPDGVYTGTMQVTVDYQ